MVIPSLLAHAANGQWCVTIEELQRLQAERAALEARSATYADLGAERPAPKPFLTAGLVAIVPVNGVLGKNLGYYDRVSGGCDYDDIVEAIDAAEADPGTKTILFHFRSPGGMALGCAECADRITAISKPTVAYTDYVMCSGAYWLGSQCDVIYSSISAFLGSIGVLAAYLDTSKALADFGIKVNAFSAGKWKLAGAPFKPMTDEERAMFQARVERYYAQFTAAVTRHREIAQEFMEGQSIDGLQAVEAGLCDGIFPSLDDLLVYLHAPGNGLTPAAG